MADGYLIDIETDFVEIKYKLRENEGNIRQMVLVGDC
jgi:hypothetical protein